jgi:hypothetical protein
MRSLISKQNEMKSNSEAHSALISSMRQENKSGKKIMDVQGVSITSMQQGIKDLRNNLKCAIDNDSGKRTDFKSRARHRHTCCQNELAGLCKQ